MKRSWVDIIAHMPVDGISFMSCGDLVPSGHIGFVTLALIAIVRVLPRTWIACRDWETVPGRSKADHRLLRRLRAFDWLLYHRF